jgi:hypothetical protein
MPGWILLIDCTGVSMSTASVKGMISWAPAGVAVGGTDQPDDCIDTTRDAS